MKRLSSITAWTGEQSLWKIKSGEEEGIGGRERACNKVHRTGRIKRSSITRWRFQVPIIRPCQLGCGILFRALNVLSTAKNFHKTAICHLRRPISLSYSRWGGEGGWKKSIWRKSQRQLYTYKKKKKKEKNTFLTRVYDRFKILTTGNIGLSTKLSFYRREKEKEGRSF